VYLLGVNSSVGLWLTSFSSSFFSSLVFIAGLIDIDPEKEPAELRLSFGGPLGFSSFVADCKGLGVSDKFSFATKGFEAGIS
jgi:hypothetical protein